MPGKLMRHPPGSRVSFQNPTTKQSEHGTVIDEIWLPEPESFGEVAPLFEHGWLETAFTAQLMEWNPNADDRAIRIAYYTRRGGADSSGWVFAQFAPSMSVRQCQQIFQAMQGRGWFSGELIAVAR